MHTVLVILTSLRINSRVYKRKYYMIFLGNRQCAFWLQWSLIGFLRPYLCHVMRNRARRKLCGVVTAKIKFGILLCCLPMGFLMSVNQALDVRSIKLFWIACQVLISIWVWIEWVPSIPSIWRKYETASHLVFRKRWPDAGHLPRHSMIILSYRKLKTLLYRVSTR